MRVCDAFDDAAKTACRSSLRETKASGVGVSFANRIIRPDHVDRPRVLQHVGECIPFGASELKLKLRPKVPHVEQWRFLRKSLTRAVCTYMPRLNGSLRWPQRRSEQNHSACLTPASSNSPIVGE